MRRTHAATAFLFFIYLVAAHLNASAQTSAPSQPPTSTTNDESRRVRELFDIEWEYQLRESPTFASVLGDRRYNERWNDVSLSAIEARRAHTRETMQRLAGINREKLTDADKLNFDLFKNDAEEDLQQYEFRFYLTPITHDGGIQTADQISELLRFQTVKDYEDWLARLRAFPKLMEQTIALMREGVKTGYVQPRIIMERVPAQVDKQLVAQVDDSPFFKPFKRLPDSIPAAERERLQASARQAINADIIPAFKKFKEFFATDYLPASYAQVGIWQRPRGDEAYRFVTHRFTTTNLTPEEIHQKGLREVARIRAEMERIKTSVGFTGSLPEFFKFLRSDPQFYYKTPAELLTAYRSTAKRIDPQLVKLFRTLPRIPYGVEPIPEQSAPDTTTAYYQRPAADGSRAGTYYVNLYRPETRPKYEMMALSLHESVPGHHLQIALAQEQGALPNFRRYGGYTAFVEGWGLYAESLGEDMGLYKDDPYSKFGQLTYEMWRAVRLVVDTGIHFKHWERQRAIDYFLDNAAKTELDVVNEIDRYISDPGQALAYKVGELKLKELRARATRDLGASFDIREFHDEVLKNGAVPLDVLERNIDLYIAAKKSGTSDNTSGTSVNR